MRTCKLLFLVLFFFLKPVNTFSQCNLTLVANNGYSVFIRINPVGIVPSSTNCPWGYNYNVVLNYSVNFVGSNAPANLFTLQGNIFCGSQSLFFDLPNNGGVGTFTTTSNPYISSEGNNVYTTRPSCRDATVNNLNCGTISIQANGPGLSNQTTNCPFGAPLPIELLSFTGVKAPEGILLRWETASEKNNDFFTVERSGDGLEWEILKTLKAEGDRAFNSSYLLLDSEAQEGLLYYRLKQTDYDGKFSYSPVISVLNTISKVSVSGVWPNPLENEARLLLDAPEKGKALFNVIDELGTLVSSEQLDFSMGTNELSFKTDALKPGFYLLEVWVNATQKTIRKFVKL